ncbi:hypothetical protein LJR118_003322 [Acidovorax sp. LjRoot118]|uniref:hypothetical protein n=1 Tax=unclassified Acidovorax TaxID=2684926 RepID=UPI00070EF235|nr:hypothetical protein [Acidovorax sp. Root217]KRC26100.1 hypothetical protein ASE31_18680 [Acidovorax sp. Root217]
MATYLIIGLLIVFVLIPMVLVPVMAIRDARRAAKTPRLQPAGSTKSTKPPEEQPPHPLAWLGYLLLAVMFAGLGAWHLAHPDEVMSGGKWLSAILGLTYLALGKYGPGLACMLAAAGFLVACIRRLRGDA